jgi:Recombination endonuclease VII
VKTCRDCGVSKPLEDFYVSAGCRDGHRPECKACNLAARRAKYAENPRPCIDRVLKWQHENRDRYLQRLREYNSTPAKKVSNRKSHLKRKYGLTLEAFDELLEAQGGGCAICGNPDADNVDHDHATGRVRGILCFNCNLAIGHIADDEDRLFGAIAYLARDDRLGELARGRVVALAG